jgi:hypothetical protein
MIEGRNAMYVLITLSGGLIEDVRFISDEKTALRALYNYVRSMDPDDNDAAIFAPNGMVSNAKTVLDDETVSKDANGEISEQIEAPIFIIGNPHHRLGFMVVSTDDPLGFEDPAEAVFELCQLRSMYGRHLKLYRVFQVEGSLVEKDALKRLAEDCGVDAVDYETVSEFLK